MQQINFAYKSVVQVITVMAIIGLTACGGGDGTNLDENGNPINNNPVLPLAPNLASIQQNIFTPSCGVSGCHASGTAPFGLRLDDQSLSAQLLINISSVEAPTLLRVKPFDPDNSYIVHKIEGTQTAGGRMPLNRTPLSATQIQVIRDWIANGAVTTSSTSLAASAQTDNITISDIQQSVFTPHCVTCHTGDAPPGGLSLEQGNSYNNLVNTRRIKIDPAYPVRVIPGDAENSFLMKKLEGRLKPDEGVQMPLSQQPLTDDLIEQVRMWINTGALQ